MTQPHVPDPAPAPDQELPFVSHLVELRDRLLRIVLAVLLVFVVLFPFANDIYTLLAQPLMRHMPEGSSMIATEVASPFLVPFKLTLVLAFFITIPYILYQVWGFVAPGLYRHEKSLVLPLVVSSTLLYYLGMAFAYFIVFPMIFAFFIGVAPEGVTVMTDISKYLDFVLKLFFAFGVAFEVPVATILLVKTGMTTPDALAEKRPYIIVGVFVIAMLLTPPDIISQTLLAVPVWLLFEVGVYMSRLMVRRDAARAGEGGDDLPPASPPPGGPPPYSPPTGGGGAAGATSSTVAAGAGSAAAAAAVAVPAALQVDEQLYDDEEDKDDEQGDPQDDKELEQEFQQAIDEDERISTAYDRKMEQAGKDPVDNTSTPPDSPEGVDDPDRFVTEGWAEEIDLMSGEPRPSPDPAVGGVDDHGNKAPDPP